MRTTRTKRLKRKQRKQFIIKLFKTLFSNIWYFIVALVYIVIKTYVELEKTIIKIFKIFPKWFVRLTIWIILINIYTLNNKAPEIIEKIITKTEIKEIIAVKEILVEPEKCSYGIYECAIYDEALEQGLNDEQAKISIAISQWETGHYKSSLFKNNNNIGGLYNSSARKFYTYSSVEDGIEAYVRNLNKGYFDKGLNTIESIQKKYCPVGAKNDPTGLNKNWLGGVTQLYNQL
jgi:hypothetical protein